MFEYIENGQEEEPLVEWLQTDFRWEDSLASKVSSADEMTWRKQTCLQDRLPHTEDFESTPLSPTAYLFSPRLDLHRRQSAYLSY
ncbi:hypothetical protein SESBI_18074 [Sesbania bispinosa]|nr:hypothetical protein SESBI_18074 [Sesbania bispinosa]